VLSFVNDEVLLFLLPRFISCSLRADGINFDILEALESELDRRSSRFSTMFTEDEKRSLIPPLKYLYEVAMREYGNPDLQALARVVAAIETRT
jgi:hypothetical protein